MSKTLPQKLFDIQQRIRPLVKDSDNPFFKSKYADLNQCLELVKEQCKQENLVLVQGPDIKEGHKGVKTVVVDVDTGQSIDCFVPYSGNEKNAQEIGLSTTYFRRFGIVSLFALEQEDDDAETAVGRGKNQGDGKSSFGPNNLRNGDGENKPGPVVKASTPVQTEVPKQPSKETILKKISLTSKVIIDSKRDSQDNVVKMLEAFGVKKKEDLTLVQAAKLLSQLEEKLK